MSQPTISKPPFARRHYPRAALATLIVALLPGAASAEAARVTFSHGPVAATAADGARRALARGAEIDAGDTISTGRGRAQLRFTDGSFVSLKPNTDFRVDEYQFKGANDTNERGFFSLLRGGLRTITGLVGRVRKGRYRMRTAVATLGIRGTEYNLDLITNDSGQPVLKWNVADDGASSIVLVLASGRERTFSWGGAGSATREEFELLAKTLQQLAEEGRLESVSREELVEIFASGDGVGDDGRAQVLAGLVLAAVDETPAPSPACDNAMPSCTIAAAFGAFRGGERSGVYVDGGQGNLSATFAQDGSLEEYSHPDGLFIAADGGEGFVESFDTLSNAQVSSASAMVDGTDYFSVDPGNPKDPMTIATWGRWVAPGASTGPDDEAHGLSFRNGKEDVFAYAISIPPPETYNAGAGTYSLAGFTPPGVLGGGAAALGDSVDVDGSLTVNFSTGFVEDLTMTVRFENGTYNVSENGGLAMYARGGFTGTGTPFFKGDLTVTGSGPAMPCGAGGISCDGYAAGNVFGPRADGAALGYEIQDSYMSSSVTGAAVFQQDNCAGCEVLE